MTERYEQMSLMDIEDFAPDTWCGKTSPAHSQATTARTSAPSSKKRQGSPIRLPLFLDLTGGGSGQTQAASWEMGGALLGAYTMHSFGEFPKEENASRLSQILEEQAHPKYSLSAKACAGILSRAQRRGKALPEVLKAALENQATPSRSGGGV